jgi:hypothetical protein
VKGCVGGQDGRSWSERKWDLFFWCGGLYDIFRGHRCGGVTEQRVLEDPFIGQVMGWFVNGRSDDLMAKARVSLVDIFQEGSIVEGSSKLVGRLV